MPSSVSRRERNSSRRKAAFLERYRSQAPQPSPLPSVQPLPKTHFFANDVCGVCKIRPGKGRIEIGHPKLTPISCKVCLECGHVLPDLLREHGFAGLHAILNKNLITTND